MKRIVSAASPILTMILAVLALAPSQPATAAGTTPDGPRMPCSGDYQVDVTLDSGARWQMCWEPRFMEGVVLRDVTFTPVGGEPLLVAARINPAQIHVPYDDNGARYHDVSDYGLGGVHLSRLDSKDCPSGTTLKHRDRPVVCQSVVGRGYVSKYYAYALQGQAMRLFSVSHVGEYNYIFDYGFYDDGSIEFAAGASGKLQRYTRSVERGEKYGWPLGQMQYGIAHVHNYYWRIDLDLGGSGNDAVDELSFPPEDETLETRVRNTLPLASEAARSVDPENFRSWQIKDSVIVNEDGHAISYQLEADPAHRFHGPDYESFTHNEVYATVYRPCERFASHNPAWAGCGTDLTAFADGEALTGQDLVLWYGMAFHHLPRDEDDPKMHTHWSRFFMVPRDLTAVNPLALEFGNDAARKSGAEHVHEDASSHRH